MSEKHHLWGAAVFFVLFEGVFWQWGRLVWDCLGLDPRVGVCTYASWQLGGLALIVSIFCFMMFLSATRRSFGRLREWDV